MNVLEYVRRLKVVFLILTVIFIILCRNAKIGLEFLHPWFSALLVNLLLILVALSAVIALFKLITDRIMLFERNTEDSAEEKKFLLKSKNELVNKVEALTRKAEELSTLHRTIRSMSQTMDLDKILNIILENICKYLSYDRAILCLADESRIILEARHAIGIDGTLLRGIRFSLDDKENFAVKALLNGLPSIIDKVPDSLEVFKYGGGEENILAVMPLEAKDRIIGVLIVDNVVHKRKLEEKDLRALQTFTSQAAVALENARLYQTEKNFKEELQKQVDIAVEKLKQAQDQLIQSEKLAALGQMAAVVTHEVRNPLSTIRGSAEIISRKAGSDSPLRKFTEYIIQEVERLDLVVNEILAFSRKPQLTLSKANINTLIEQTLDFLETSDFLKYKVSCTRNLASNVPDTFLDSDQIKQVLLNILLNACHFMEKSPVRNLSVNTRVSNSQIYIGITDTGPGIPQENLEKIFEPFFTTKARGTGLGLSICKNIIESHMGRVDVETRINEAAVFTVVLPILRKEG
ncbi:MAG: ATP-binding protein [Elusimicrobiota bacterium]